MNDVQLLSAYVSSRDERSFGALVHRYLPLVYSAAIRQVGDPGTAEDVAQAVFIVLAEKAGSLRGMRSLGGWLVKVTHFCACDAIKSGRRRVHHEQRAAGMRSETVAPPENAWTQVAPHLDVALARLSDADRGVLVLKFFEDQTLEEMGASLGISKDAANKRVSRALDRLRALLGPQGGPSSAGALAATLAGKPIVAVPPHLYSVIPAAVVHGAAASAGSSALIAKGVLQMMSGFQLKLGVAVALVVAAVGGATAIVAIETRRAAQVAAPIPVAAPAVSAVVGQGGGAYSPDAPITLASGVSAQVVAIADAARLRDALAHKVPIDAWAADGSEADFPKNWQQSSRMLTMSNDPESVGRVFVLNVRYPKELDVEVNTSIVGMTSFSSGRQPTRGSLSFLFAGTFPKEKATATIRVNVAAGAWETILHSNGQKTASTTDARYGDFSLGEASTQPMTWFVIPQGKGNELSQERREANQLAVTLQATPPLSANYRMVVIDKGDVAHTSDHSSAEIRNVSDPAAKLLHSLTFMFKDLTKEEVKEVRFEVRPYDQWIEFRNVSLNGGAETKVAVASSDVGWK